MVLIFGSVYVVDYVYSLAYVEPALHPRDESYLIIVDKLFCDVFLSLLAIVSVSVVYVWSKTILSMWSWDVKDWTPLV